MSLPLPLAGGGECCAFFCSFFRVTSPIRPLITRTQNYKSAYFGIHAWSLFERTGRALRHDTGRTHQAYIWIFSLILEEETQVSQGLVTELMLPVFIHMAFSKNVRLSPTPPPFRVGRCTLPTSFSKKQPLRGNNVASPNSIFCATLKQGARGRAEAGYQRCRKMWDRGVAKGV